MAALQLWWDTIRGVVTTAPREHFDVLRGDVRCALRNLRRHPGFTAVAALALAVGIGANTAVFTIVNNVLIRALPPADPATLVTMFEKGARRAGRPLRILRARFRSCAKPRAPNSGMAAYRNVRYELSGAPEPERLIGTRVSPELFDVLGVAPMLGRSLTADDDRQNLRVVVLTYGLRSRAFGRDPSIVGRSVLLDRHPYVVVGVMPERFGFPPRGSQSNGEPAAFLVPIAFSAIERQDFGGMYQQQRRRAAEAGRIGGAGARGAGGGREDARGALSAKHDQHGASVDAADVAPCRATLSGPPKPAGKRRDSPVGTSLRFT